MEAPRSTVQRGVEAADDAFRAQGGDEHMFEDILRASVNGWRGQAG